MKALKRATSFMKKPLTVMVLLAGVLSGYSQGQMEFGDYFGQNTLQQQFFNVQSTPPSGATPMTVTYGGYTEQEYLGSTAAAIEMPQGSAVFAAGTALSGAGFDAQLLGVAGANDSLEQLMPLGGILHFYTEPEKLGLIKSSSLVTIPGAAIGSDATIAIAVWDNEGGADSTLAKAQADDAPWGISNLAKVTVTNPPSPLFDTSGIEGFSLGVNEVPEPGTVALGLFGATAFLFRQRK